MTMAPEVDQYGIVGAGALPELVARVNRMIAQGWQPIGGVCTTIIDAGDGTTAMQHAQAIVHPKALIQKVGAGMNARK